MGSKSSGSAHTPVEAKDSLKSTQFVRILDLLGEGSLSGWGNGGDSDDAMLKSTYFNDTPVLSETGEANFKGAKVAYLLGSEDQGYLPNFDTTENTVAVGTEVKNATPIVRTVTDSQLDRVIVTIRTGQMVRVNDQGDQNRTSVDLVVELMKDGATFSSRNVHIKGKTSDHFFRDVEFENLPEAPFQIRVRRVTGDSSSSKLQNQTYFASYVEIINAKLSYPHSAVVGVEFDSELFGSSIPTRNYLVKGLQIKVPSNYDPEARTYTGFWDGTFKVAFSNNPAWVFYDLVTSKRYGLGRKISPNQVDKWSLYSVAQYCDQLVDNGQGTMEPRFTCNAYLTEMRQAYEVLQDLVSCFRGMYVWDGQNVSVTIDRKSDPVAMYTNSNVMDGIFSYSSSPLNTIATAVQVQYVDAEDGYRTKTEYVSDDLAVRRYGLNVKRITSFGCTSRSQAIRTGKWLLETSRLERQTVTFSVGRAGLKHLPYDIIQVVDNDYAGVDMAGRIETVNQNLVTLDRPVSDLTGTEFSYLNTLGKLVTSEIVKQVSPTVLRLADVIVPHVTATFVIRSKGLGKRFFRALTISEDQDNGSYTINAVEHIPEKESVVDNGVEFEPAPNTIYDRLPIITGTQVQQGGDGVVVEWSGQGSTAGVTYQVKVYRNDLLMNTYNDLVAPVITLSNLQPGKYKLEIRARNKNGQWSEPEIREFVIDYNITTLQATPELWSVRLNWTLPNTAGVGYKTQIWYSETDEFTTAQKLADVATPTTTLTHTNLELMQKYYYWARIEDAKGITGEPSNSVWCGPSTDEKLITEYLKGKVDATLIADETLTIAKFAKSIIPPRFVETLPVLPNPDYALNSIVTYQGALYQNIGNVWKPMVDEKAINDKIDSSLGELGPDIPEEVATLPTQYINKKFVVFEGSFYVWNGTEYVSQVDDAAIRDKIDTSVADAAAQMQVDLPKRVLVIPANFNGNNNLVLESTGQLYTWNEVKSSYVPQFDSEVVDSAINQAKTDLSVDIPQRVDAIPVAHNGSNNLVLKTTGQIYAWNGTKYVIQFDKTLVTQEVQSAVDEVSVDIPHRVTSIPATYNGFNNLVLASSGQMYSWNGTKYVVQFDQSVIEDTVTQITTDLVEQAVHELAADVPLRVDTIPAVHNGSNNLVLKSTGQIYAWNGSAYKVQFQQNLTQGVIDASTIQGTKIADGTISTAQLAANSVTASQIAAGSITTAKLGANSVTTAQLAAGSVTATQLTANSVIAGKIAAGAVTANTIAANAVTASAIAANAVSAGAIAANAITTDKIAAGVITGDKIAAGTITANKLLVGSSVNLVPDPNFVNGLDAWGPWTQPGNFSVVQSADMVSQSRATAGLRVTSSGVSCSIFAHKGGYTDPNSGFQVSGGESFLFTCKISAKGALPTAGSIAFSLYGNRKDGAEGTAGTFVTINASSITNDWVEYTGTVTLNNLFTKVDLYLFASNFSGTVDIIDFRLVEQASAELIVDGAITALKVAAGAITTEKLAAGAVTANEIAANTITADKLIISSGANLITDPQFLTDRGHDASLSLNVTYENSTDGKSARVIHVKAVNSNIGSIPLMAGATMQQDVNLPESLFHPANQIAARVGERFNFEFWAKKVSGEGTINMLAYPRLASGARPNPLFINVIVQPVATTPTNWTLYRGEYTLPDGYIGFVPTLYLSPLSAGAEFYISGASVSKKATAELIVNGAITSDSLAANAVTAGKIAAEAVTTSNLAAGAVTADKVRARSISVDKLLVTASHNLNNDPQFLIPRGTTTGGYITYVDDVGSMSTKTMRFDAGNNTASCNACMQAGITYDSDPDTGWLQPHNIVRVTPEQVLQVQFWVRTPTNGGAKSAGDVSIIGYPRNASGAQAGGTTYFKLARVDATDITTSWVKYSGQWTIQPAVVGVNFGIFFEKLDPGAVVLVSGVEVFQKASGELIVDGAITANKIVAGAITGDKIAANTITGNKIAARTIDAGRIIAGAITANELAVNSITAAKIAAGAVGADQIAARAISTDKMVIGLGNNLVPDPTWESGFENWRLSTGAANAEIRERTASLYPTTAPSTRVVRITGVSGIMTHKASYATESDGIPVVAGEEYLFSFDLARATSPVTSGSVRVQGYFYCQDGVQRATTEVITDMNSFAPGPWTSVVVPITVPATAVKMRMYIYFTPFSGVAEFCNPVIFKRTTGELIVDGSITTDKLAANSITSAKILAGSIQAAHIAAGTITGDRIAANQTLTAPNISGGSANFGGGRVTITTAGVFSLRANPTSNVGLQINSDNVLVYDAAGKLRVKLGLL